MVPEKRTMQYKIPVQIENEDRIILGLSLRQLIIILVGGAIAYGVFTKLAGGQSGPNAAGNESGKTIGIALAVLIVGVSVVIAKFNNHEMTFLPFVLNWLRLVVNGSDRYWGQGVDSAPPLQVGYVTRPAVDGQSKSHAKQGHEIYASLEDKLKNL